MKKRKSRELLRELEQVSSALDKILEAKGARKSARERAQEQQERISRFFDEIVEKVGTEETLALFRRWLDVASRFHRYSLNNIILILLQRPDATLVAGFQTWKRLGRHVKRGEKGIKILAPILVKVPCDDATADAWTDLSEEEEDGCARLVGFRVVHVFDIAQTEGKPLPDPQAPWKSLGGGDEELAFVERVKAIAKTAFGVTMVEVAPHAIPDKANGVSFGGVAYVSNALPPLQKASVTVHELAHELLHWKNAQDDGQEISYEQAEVEAEAVAYIVLRAFGFAPVGNPAYIVNWAATGTKDAGEEAREALRRSMERILRTSRRIINAVEKTKEVKDAVVVDSSCAAAALVSSGASSGVQTVGAAV